jgi:hypothetical protein
MYENFKDEYSIQTDGDASYCPFLCSFRTLINKICSSKLKNLSNKNFETIIS